MPPLLADFIHPGVCKPICAKSLTLPVAGETSQNPTSIKKIAKRKAAIAACVSRFDSGFELF